MFSIGKITCNLGVEIDILKGNDEYWLLVNFDEKNEDGTDRFISVSIPEETFDKFIENLYYNTKSRDKPG